MQEFKSHYAHYFINTKDRVTNKAKVTKILGCFEESMVDDWTSTNQEQLMKMTFPNFMKEFQQWWLPHNWEKTVWNEMLGMHLDLDHTQFELWVAQIMAHNISLCDTKSFVMNKQLQV